MTHLHILLRSSELPFTFAGSHPPSLCFQTFTVIVVKFLLGLFEVIIKCITSDVLRALLNNAEINKKKRLTGKATLKLPQTTAFVPSMLLQEVKTKYAVRFIFINILFDWGRKKAGSSCTNILHVLQCSGPLKEPKTGNVLKFWCQLKNIQMVSISWIKYNYT